MTIFYLTLERILLLFMFILAGFVLVKVKALPKTSGEVLSKLENNLLIPALVFSTFASSFKMEKIAVAWKLFVLGAVVCVIMMLFSWIVVPRITKDGFTQNLYTYGLVFSNFGFMGNAIVSAVFPDIFLEYLIFTLPMWTLIYVWGVPCLLIPRGGGNRFISRLKSFVNPMFIAMLLGIAVGVTGYSIPTFLSSAIETAGDCMSPVSMILTGVIVASSSVGRVLKNGSIYVMTFIRLLLLPFLGILIFYIFRVPEAYYVCTICALAMPLGLNIMVIPSGYGKDTSLAAGAIIVSHLVSSVTIPFVFALMSQLIR